MGLCINDKTLLVAFISLKKNSSRLVLILRKFQTPLAEFQIISHFKTKKAFFERELWNLPQFQAFLRFTMGNWFYALFIHKVKLLSKSSVLSRIWPKILQKKLFFEIEMRMSKPLSGAPQMGFWEQTYPFFSETYDTETRFAVWKL